MTRRDEEILKAHRDLEFAEAFLRRAREIQNINAEGMTVEALCDQLQKDAKKAKATYVAVLRKHRHHWKANEVEGKR